MQILVLDARDTGDTILGDRLDVWVVEDDVQHGCVKFTCLSMNASNSEHDNREMITNQQTR